jgi:serine/threonine protein kinase
VIASEEEKKDFLEEGLRMKDLDHTNVLSLVGFSFNGDKPLIVTPYMENGDMLTYIKNKRDTITNETLLGFAIQVANGIII